MATSRKAPRPTKIKVGWATYSVDYLSDEDWNADKSLRNTDGGMCWPGSLQIFIRIMDSSVEDVLREVLLHEVLHAIMNTSAAGYSLNAVKTKDLEEFVVAATAGPLLGVLRDNQAFLRWLLDT